MPIDAGPFYFAWVDSGVAFDPAVHNVMDEYIFSFRRILKEGDKPRLDVEMMNPHIGILNPARKTSVWLAWLNPATGAIEPLFHGRVVAAPAGIFSEVITLQFVAWPTDYFARQQRLAETLKVPPYWDPVFIDVIKRDDPDTVLEARSARFCVDPVTLEVTVSDILVGEDGNEDFTADDVFYDSVKMSLKEAPLTACLMDATVSWTQTARGFVDMGNKVIVSYGGDGIINDWPKPLSQLQGGWSVQSSIAVDVWHIASALTGSFTYQWTNSAKQHEDGDALSLSISMTMPQLQGGYLSYKLTEKSQSGVLDPFAVDGDGDPAPLNIPASSDVTTVYCPLWQVNTSLVLRYDAARQRTERVLILLQGDFQAIINDPLVTQNSETITRTGTDVGVPIVNLLNSTSVRGQPVTIGQVIFPDDPELPGGRSAQIATNSGTAGASEPEFSDIPGDTTADNDVVWASLGTQSPTEGALDWTGVSHVPLGEIILPRQPLYISFADLTLPGLMQFPPVGVNVALGEVVGSPDSAMVCVVDGIVGGLGGDTALFTAIGQLPDGKTHYICTKAGLTGPLYVIPPFGANTALHSTITDGSVEWTAIGTGDIPAGGTPGNVWARSYFASERGTQSLEYLIAVQRAHMLNRARAVELSWDCSFGRGVSVTCRKTGTLHDTRIPGGTGLGKIVYAELSVVGDTGEAITHITAGCAIGYGRAVEEVAGEPVYVDTDYVDDSYQQFTGQTIVLPTLTDVGYSPPIAAPDDDGLVFPLDKDQIVVSEAIKGDVGAQAGAIMSAFASMAKAAQIAQIPVGSIAQSIENQQIEILANANSVSRAIQLHPVYYDAQIKPVNSGPFFDLYKITTTKLQAPQGINLEAASTP